MSAFRDRQIVIELVVRSGHPALLVGLDAWLQLGLISDAFVRHLAQEELSCVLPEVVPMVTATKPSVLPNPAIADESEAPLAIPSSPRRRSQPNLLSQTLQAFMAEISVVWLLFLGVFLVVVSSGVLAATQWQNFSILGQYGILLNYTLAFAIASLWTRPRLPLQLTHRMLTIATLLLIPVNFWMMDVRLWQQASGIGLAAIAALLLTGTTVLLLRQSEAKSLIAIVVLLSWLHWGWQQPGIPLIATYIGVLGATTVLLWQDQRRHRQQVASDPPTLEVTPLPLSPIAIALAATLLIGRALFAAQVPIQQLGLAVAGCGWVLCWLARRDRTRMNWNRGGTVLLVLGWLVTVAETHPWQAFAVTGLGLHLVNDALWRTGRSPYLVVGFLLGWQSAWLGWRLFPTDWQSQIVPWATRITGPEAMPLALMGLGFFPYVMVMAGLTVRWHRRDRPQFAQVGEWLALALGTGLIAISLGNPLVRSLTLTLASLTLTTVAWNRRPTPTSWVYLTHGTLLASLLAWMAYCFPLAAPQQWVIILLGLLALEWTYSGVNQQRWEPQGKSAWHFGMVLAGLSYALLWREPWKLTQTWQLSWLLTPILLTGLSYRDRFPPARLAAGLSALTLLLAQPLFFNASNLRLASLGLATLLMVLNARTLQKLPIVILTVAFGVSFWSFTLWELWQPRLTFSWGLMLMALTVLILWSLRGIVQTRRSQLARLYRIAFDSWAIAGLLLTFLFLSFSQVVSFIGFSTTTWQELAAGGILVFATAFRTWQAPSNAGWFAIAWSLELLTVSSWLLTDRPLTDLAIANLILGFLAQLAGNHWVGWRPEAGGRRQEAEDTLPTALRLTPHYPLSWHLIPVVYGLLALGLAHATFTATTGLYTLAIAVLGSQIGRRSRLLAPITYLSLGGISVGAFELLSYQLSQAKGGQAGDGITLMAGLAIALVGCYFGLRQRLVAYFRLAILEFEQFIQVHWVLGTGMLGWAVITDMSRTGQFWWTAIILLYALYALVISRQVGTDQSSSSLAMTHAWTYAGIWQLFAAIASGLWLLLPTSTLVDWAGAIAAIVAGLVYQAPWQRWGWHREPWQQSASLLPGVVILLTGWGANLQSLLVTAAFYAGLASIAQTIRYSYIAILLADWALIRVLVLFNLTQPLWYAAIAGVSILYLAQVEPTLQIQERYEQRHWVRSLATALICLTGFYQAAAGITGLSPFVAGFVAIAIEFGFILLGLVQRVRAFLYVGTLTFILQIFWQLWRFIRDYSLLLWLVGIVVGLILIWVAATFEARRTQANALLQQWVTELEDWQ
jgi:hypothetical protein